MPTVNFYSASVGATTPCRFPNLYSPPSGAPELCWFPCYLMVKSYTASWKILFSWYLVLDLYTAWWRFLDHFPRYGGLRICKALSGADLITLPPHGGLRFYKALNGVDLVFLTGYRRYGWSCLHIIIGSLLHCYCGVFIPVEIRSCLNILLASLLHWSCGLFIPFDIIILVGYLYPCPLLGVWLPCLFSHRIVCVLLILLILGDITHDYDVTVSLHFLFAMANNSVNFGNSGSPSFHCRYRPFFTHSAIDAVHSSLSPLKRS